MKKQLHNQKTGNRVKSFLLTTTLMLMSILGISQTAYIANNTDSTVSVIDIATNNVSATIHVGWGPWGVAVSPDGNKIFVTNTGDNSVSVINTSTNTVTATIGVGNAPQGITILPNGSKVYVTNQYDDAVSVINTNTNTLSTTIPVGFIPIGIASSPDGSKVYVATQGDTTIKVINTFTDTIVASISVVNTPNSLCFSPDGSKVYFTGNDYPYSVGIINTATNTISGTITFGSGSIPYGICVSPDGNKLYVGYWNDDTVSVINTTTNSISNNVIVGNSPWGTSITPDGSKVYFANSSGNSVSVINTATNTVSATIPVGNSPFAVGNFISIYPSHCLAFYTTTYDSTLNTFTLNVDSLTSLLGTAYHWDFGDGTTSTLASPTHSYTVDTVYNVCMKIFTATGDSCEYCHIIGKDYLGNIYRTAGFTLNVHNNSTVLVPDVSKESIMTIAPNPFTSQTTIKFSETQKNTTIKITDVLGKELKTINFTGRQLVIDKAEMKAGIYFVQTTDEQKRICNKKIIIQ